MEKPQPYEAKKVINLIDVLEYINELVPGSYRKIWKHLCDLNPITNDTITNIYWEGILESIKSNEDHVAYWGYGKMMSEFPEIRNNEVNYWVSW